MKKFFLVFFSLVVIMGGTPETKAQVAYEARLNLVSRQSGKLDVDIEIRSTGATSFVPATSTFVFNHDTLALGGPVKVAANDGPWDSPDPDYLDVALSQGKGFAGLIVEFQGGGDENGAIVPSSFTRIGTVRLSILDTTKSWSLSWRGIGNITQVEMLSNPGTPNGGLTDITSLGTFIVNNPVPTLSSISPTSKIVGDTSFTLTVNGVNFVSSSVVQFNGANKATTFTNSKLLTALIPASDLTTVGTFNITVFSPTPGGGTSNSKTFTVKKKPTVSFLTTSPNPSTYGQSVTFRDSVVGSVPDGGKAYFKVDGVTVDSASIDLGTGVATVTKSNLTGGSHSIKAFYGGTANFDTSTSNTVVQVVKKKPTVSFLTTSPNPSTYGQSVTFRDSVVGSVPDGGKAYFKVDGVTVDSVNINLGTGVATATKSNLTAGSHSVWAFYGGTANFDTSTSNVVTQTVNKKPTVSFLTTSPNPSTYGQSVTLKDSVSGSVPNGGKAYFKVDGVVVDSGIVSTSTGVATVTKSNLTAGSHSIQAFYGGTANIDTSSSNVVTQTVRKKSTVSVLTTSPNPSTYGQSVTFKDSVIGSVPEGGKAYFKVDGVVVDSANVSTSTGVATVTKSNLTAGSHSIQALYSGTANIDTSSSNVVTQTVGKKSTVSVLTTSPNPSTFGQSATFKDSVIGSVPDGGKVYFKVDGVVVDSASIDLGTGVATVTKSNFTVGSYSIRGFYGGTANYDTSSSNVVTQTVGKKSTTSFLTSSHNPSAFGESVTLKDSVSGSIPDGGTVQFKDSGSNLGSPIALDVTGVATLITSSLGGGTHNITARYNGTANFDTSTSNIVVQVVNRKSTASFLTTLPNPSTFGHSVTFKDSVSGSVPDGGKAYFKVDGVVVDSVNINGSGVATVTKSNLTGGSHSVQAFYGGTVNFDTSNSNAVTQTVNKKSTLSILSTSPNPSTFGQSVTFKDSVIGSVPDGGKVYFKVDGVVVDSANIDGSGVATVTKSNLTAGSHSIQGSFGGTANFDTSSSSVVVQTVGKKSTLSILSTLPNPSTFGQSVTFKDSVIGSVPDGGKVYFKVNGVLVDSAEIDPSGVATMVDSNLSVGLHSVQAFYAGTSNFDTSSSSVAGQTVQNLVVNTKVFLQGPYSSGSMSTALKTFGYLPLTQPYSGSPWNHSGSESVDTMPANVVDWVLVELRGDTSSTSKVATRAAFLMSNGMVVDTNGGSPVSFLGVHLGSYRIVVRHRNHIAIMSANPVGLSSSSALYDFTFAAAQAYGLSPLKELSSGVFGMFCGDVDLNGGVGASDLVNTRGDVGVASYVLTDIDLNGGVGASDIVLIRSNIGQFGQVPP